jgi:gluconolactonase
MYAAPPLVMTEVHAVLPDHLRKLGHPSAWLAGREAAPTHSFLEGPAFDREGNLYCVDIPFGRILRIALSGEWSTFAEYEGEPNGLKIHRDGRIFVADSKLGLLSFDPVTAEHSVVHDRPLHERFIGLNDLTFASNGDLYFTDMGQSALQRPIGRVFRLRADGKLELIIDGLAGPNGLVLSLDERMLFIACTYWNAIVRVPLRRDGSVGKAGIHIHLSGPLGPDGMAVDQDDNLAVVHARSGTVWLFSARGEPLYRLKSCAGDHTTNVTYQGNTLYVTEAGQGVILKAKLPVAGKPMYSHL